MLCWWYQLTICATMRKPNFCTEQIHEAEMLIILQDNKLQNNEHRQNNLKSRYVMKEKGNYLPK